MHLLLFRASGDALQIGFHGSSTNVATSHCPIDDVLLWARSLWSDAGSLLCESDVVEGVLCQASDTSVESVSPSTSSRLPTCMYACMSFAVPLTTVGEQLNIDGLKNSGTSARLLFVVVSPFPNFSAMHQSISQTLTQLRLGQIRTNPSSGESSGAAMSSALYNAWCTHVPTGSLPPVIPRMLDKQPQDGLVALDGQSSSVTSPGANVRLESFQLSFPSYISFRLLQSIVLLGRDSVIVVGSNADTISACTIAISCLSAPMSPVQNLVPLTSCANALKLLQEGADCDRACIIGIHASGVPKLILTSMEREAASATTVWWAADTRTGIVARIPSSASPSRSLMLMPNMDRIKDALRSGRNSSSDLVSAMLDSMAVVFGSYRKYLVARKGSIADHIDLQRLLLAEISSQSASPSVSQNHQAAALTSALSLSPVWATFQNSLLRFEGDPSLKQTFVAYLRGVVHVPREMTVSEANILNFMLRSCRRFPELFAEELAAAGRPLPKDAAATAGRFVKGLFGKAIDAVAQIAGSATDMEYGRHEPPFCQCYDAFVSQPLTSTSASAQASAFDLKRRSPPPAVGNSLALPADIVHHFHLYHELLVPKALSAATSTIKNRSSAVILGDVTVERRSESPSVVCRPPSLDSSLAPPTVSPSPSLDRAGKGGGGDVLDELFSASPAIVKATTSPESRPQHVDRAAGKRHDDTIDAFFS